MSTLIRSKFNYKIGATLVGFFGTLSLVAIIGWATIGTKPVALFAHVEYSKV